MGAATQDEDVEKEEEQQQSSNDAGRAKKRAASANGRGKKKRAKLVNRDGQEVFEVSCIVKERVGRDGRQYLVRWKNYSDDHNSWEPAAAIECLELVMQDWRER